MDPEAIVAPDRRHRERQYPHEIEDGEEDPALHARGFALAEREPARPEDDERGHYSKDQRGQRDQDTEQAAKEIHSLRIQG
jgi:hypothetical protein